MNNLRVWLLLVLLLGMQKVYAQQEVRITWQKDSLLKWSDFKGPVDSASIYSASTFCGIDVHYDWKLLDNKYTFRFTSKAYFVPSKSWTKEARQKSKLLKHEQVHFDIVEYFSRLELSALTNHVYNASFKSDIELINQRIGKEKDAMQAVYDDQTNHSKNGGMQLKWELYVADLLKETPSLEIALKRQPTVE